MPRSRCELGQEHRESEGSQIVHELQVYPAGCTASTRAPNSPHHSSASQSE